MKFGPKYAGCGSMSNHQDITTLEELLDRIEQTSEDEEQVSLQMIADSVGDRSFGPMLLIPALIMLAPGIGDIPGVTTTCAVVVLVISAQLLFRRKHLWLPQWLLKRSAKRERVSKLIRWIRKPSQIVDRVIHRRLPTLAAGMVIAIGCTAVALVMPMMEVVPFGGMIVGAALAAYGLALIAQDGLLAIIAYASTVASFGAALYFLL